MAATMTEFKSIKAIKPSSSTPPHLQTYKLSFLDQRSPHIFFNLNYFYAPVHAISSSGDTDSQDHITRFYHRSKILQDSLSETLTLFYPFAGRFQDDATIICNDEGVVFMETQANFSLSDILTSPDLSIIDKHLVPTRYPEAANESFHGSQIFINFILFACGGTAICIANTHKISDMTTWMAFLNCWCASSRGLEPPVIPDLHTIEKIFPGRGVPQKIEHSITRYNTRMKRFVFRASKVQQLKSKLLSNLRKEGYENFYPSRVDAVTALIWRCLMYSSKSTAVSFKPSIMFKAIDPRMRMDPPLSRNAMGNMAWLIPMLCEEESETELCELLKKMMALKSSLEKIGKKLNGEKLDELLKEEAEERKKMFCKHGGQLGLYVCTTFCKFGHYELEFAGMGKPVWVTSVAPETFKNFINLTDTKVEGEVEALVYLKEEDMNAFASNEELLQFAELNPSVI